MMDVMQSELQISAVGLFNVDLKILPKVPISFPFKPLNSTVFSSDIERNSNNILQLLGAMLTYLVIVFQFQFNET